MSGPHDGSSTLYVICVVCLFSAVVMYHWFYRENLLSRVKYTEVELPHASLN